jgi:UDP-2,4-diacetamido-2,4,6-trideoxy-beta-L-altropyranose hydrolase
MRADASVDIGSGHLMRCLTLADQLQGVGAEVAFVCRDLPGAMFDLLQARGYRSAKLPLAEAGNGSQHFDAQETIRAAGRLFPDGFEWLVVDHYELDAVWERMLRPHVCKLMVIDDLANRRHDCDLLLDQNYYRDLDQRYQGLVPEQCVTLLGPAYVLLRPEFAEARQRLRARAGVVRRILVFFGGSDSTNQTRKALDALKLVSRPEVAVDVIVGASNPYRDEIQSLCQEMPNTQYHCQVSNMAELISAADIAIGAGGATTWERCSLGLPTLTVVFADNQLQTTLDLEQFGATIFLGWANKITASDLAYAIENLIENPALLRNISERACFVLSEWQGAEAITAAMRNILTNFKRAC